jgi:hypothetical protein
MFLVMESLKKYYKIRNAKVKSTFNIDKKEDFITSDFKNLQFSESKSSDADK